MCSVQHESSPPVFVTVIYRPPDAELIKSDLAVALKRYSVGFIHRVAMGDLIADILRSAPGLDSNNMAATQYN